MTRTDRRARLRKRAASGDACACDALAVDLGSRAPLRLREAAQWLEKAAEQGLAEAQNDLGLCYDRGVGVRKNARKAVFWWRKAAEQGWGAAQLNLGLAHARGEGVRRDRHEANRLYRRAAARGHEIAMHNLGLVYLLGRGVKRSPRRALHWFLEAARGGDLDAPRHIRDLVRDGVATKPFMLRWIRRAAELGDAPSQVDLGVALFEGDGVRRNRKEALRWYRRAARKDDEHAWYNLGQAHRLGVGVRQSWPRALACYERAAQLGHGGAACWLFEYHSGVNGKPGNARKAAVWLRRARAAAARDPGVRASLAEVLAEPRARRRS